jgi:cytolysin (calcineurin-like family phosphatase)
VKKSAVLVALVGMMTLMGGSPSFAQNAAYSFQMSSSFYAGNAKMPAGTYTLRQSGDETSIFELSNNAGSHSVMLETRSSSKTSKGKPEVLFNRYAGTDYLEAVETSDGSSIDIIPSAAEKLAAKKGSPEPHSVPTA